MKFSLVLRSVTVTWAAVIVSALTGVFLTPYILHRLGDEGYGLWVLVITLTDYYLFLRVGIRSSIVRYVSRDLALHDAQATNKVLASSFYFFMAVLLFVVCVTFILAPFVPSMFAIKAENARVFGTLFLLIGIAQGFDFPLNVFEGALEAAGRFDQIYGIRILGMILRVVMVVIVLTKGGGLFGVGAATVLSTLALRFAAVPLAYREIEGFSLHPRGLDLKTFKEMFRYGFTSFSVGIGERLSSSLYPIILGRFVSAVAVTLYSIPAKMLAIPLNGICSMTEFVSPLSSQLEAKDEKRRLAMVLLLSGQAAYTIFAPLAVIMLVFGKQMIALWLGQNYVSTYSLLVLLTFGLGLDATQYSVQSMLFGMAKHKGLVWIRLGQALGTALLGIALMKIWGLWGYALATLIVSVVVNLGLLPRAVCLTLNIPAYRYYWKAFLKPCLFSLPMLFALLLFDRGFSVTSWTSLIVAVVLGLAVYALTLLFAIWNRKGNQDSSLSLEVLELIERKILGKSGATTKPPIAIGVSEPG